MQELMVEIPQRSYPILVADGLLANAQMLRTQLCPCLLQLLTGASICPCFVSSPSWNSRKLAWHFFLIEKYAYGK